MNASATTDIVKGDSVMLTCSVRYNSSMSVKLTLANNPGVDMPGKNTVSTVVSNVTVKADGQFLGPYVCAIVFTHTNKKLNDYDQTAIRIQEDFVEVTVQRMYHCSVMLIYPLTILSLNNFGLYVCLSKMLNSNFDEFCKSV